MAASWRPTSSRLGLLLVALLALQAGASGSAPAACGPSGSIVVDLVRLWPKQPHTNQDLTVEVVGKVPLDDEPQDPNLIGMDARVLFCRRINDCMPVFHFTNTLCAALEESGDECRSLRPGDDFLISKSWHLPLLMVRGTYTLLLQFHRLGQNSTHSPAAYQYYQNAINSQFYRPKGDVMSCYTLHEEVLASRQINVLRDYRDAIMAFLIAASSSRAIGSHFPVWSQGVLPQISGFLFIGILVGPYCANLVSEMHITIIGGIINKISLAFIAGAAGAEIFVPELQGLLKPMALQVLLICIATLVICTGGLFLMQATDWVPVMAISMQQGLAAKGSLCLLMAALMTARSPASAIAIISELKCSDTKAGSMAIGITVLSDIAVLILFALSSQLVRVSSSGNSLGPFVLLGVFLELSLSAVLGYLTGQLMRMALPRDTGHAGYNACASKEEKDKQLRVTSCTVLLGLLLIFILYAAFCIAEGSADLTGGRLRLEPLLVCTVAACVCGHDESRREALLEALSAWTPVVLLPFFTLAGASLQLSSLSQVLPAALCLVVLRALGIAVGSAGAGMLSRVLMPDSNTTKEVVQYTWLTLLAQAGVTLGLVLEVQHSFDAPWTQPFATLVISVVVINQLLGPVCCRIALQRIVAAEVADGPADGSLEDPEASSEIASETSSDRSSWGLSGQNQDSGSLKAGIASFRTHRSSSSLTVAYIPRSNVQTGFLRKFNQF
mmetsp:Transcript_126573/g.300650  ORF Transcript_126573/g.300650 Transcript_126573/m.300650 type:complete len:726 (-) Transcript_126573:101-2278(-)|eukprot:CAMPEP_0181445496 /NCGR_PEP_ID=MMETSP1110-20121109/25617_1 /TAXON_ID=174948 /ORGANISM="Symbiodinium sp., Strain CCMP421" /LENGTH=725 /DNA_ID=CAMNT_0023569541 /DNA_START=49 /DNA_END=2226 /DNA_ORIENTATION=+